MSSLKVNTNDTVAEVMSLINHDDLYDLSRIPDQQDKATLLSTDTSIFQLIPRSPILKVSNEALVYLAKQRFEKLQRNYIRKNCPNASQSTGFVCYTPENLQDEQHQL